MKKIISYIILIIFFSSTIIIGLNWASDVRVALECENNVNNTGSGSYTATNNGPTGFSTAHVDRGTYSIGLFDGNTKSVTIPAINEVLKTIQFWAWVQSAGVPSVAALYNNPINGNLIYFFGLTAYYYSPASGQFGWTVTRDAGHLYQIVYDGTHADVYYDGVHEGQEVSYQITNVSWTFGIRNAGEYCNCYEDDILLSTTNYAGVAIAPIVATPTFTWTLTPTPTYTWTLTSTLTPTPTFTLTATPTRTPVPLIIIPTVEHTLTLRVQAITDDNIVLAIHNEKWIEEYDLNINGINKTLNFPYDPTKQWWYYLLPNIGIQQIYLSAKSKGIIYNSNLISVPY